MQSGTPDYNCINRMERLLRMGQDTLFRRTSCLCTRASPFPPPPPEIDLNDPLVRMAMCSRLPADRTRLRQVLLSSLDPSHVHFSKSFDSSEVVSEGIRPKFEDGSLSPLGSILIGADGAVSRVVSFATTDDALRPIPTGHKMIFGPSPLTENLESEMIPALKEGINVARDPATGLSLFVETCRFTDSVSSLPPRPDDYVFWILTDPKGYTDDLEPSTVLPSLRGTPQLRDLALKHLSSWHPGFQALVKYSDLSKTAIWSMASSQSSIPDWKTNRRRTFLGDAVHSVVRIGGLGGNMAIHSVQTLLEMLVGQAQADGDG